MPLTLPRGGSWSIGGFKLPELGITERVANAFSRGKTSDLSNAVTRNYQSNAQGQVQGANTQNDTAYLQSLQFGRQPTTPSVSSPIRTTSSSSSYGVGSSGAQAPGLGILQNDINRSTNDALNNIDQEFEVAQGAFNNQESDLRGQAGTSEQEIRAQYGTAKTALGEQQATQEAGLSNQENTARTEGKSALQKARDLFRQFQQENIASLSGLGLSASSVAEALAERLGVETARRIAGITGSVDEIINNVAKERTRVQTFFKQKLTDLEQTMGVQIANIQQSLISGLNQINQARQMAASQKASQRAGLLSNAQSEIAKLQAQQQQFQQSLQEWATKRQSSLQEAQSFVISPTDFTGINNAVTNIQNLPAVNGFVPVPDFQTSNQGYKITPSYQKRGAVDPYEDLLRQSGVMQ